MTCVSLAPHFADAREHVLDDLARLVEVEDRKYGELQRLHAEFGRVQGGEQRHGRAPQLGDRRRHADGSAPHAGREFAGRGVGRSQAVRDHAHARVHGQRCRNDQADRARGRGHACGWPLPRQPLRRRQPLPSRRSAAVSSAPPMPSNLPPMFATPPLLPPGPLSSMCCKAFAAHRMRRSCRRRRPEDLVGDAGDGAPCRAPGNMPLQRFGEDFTR